MSFQIENGYITSQEGIPRAPRWLADGRISFSYDKTGVQYLEFYTPREHDGNNIIFKKGIFDCFRCFLLSDGKTYQPEYRDVTILPYALTARWTLEDSDFSFGVYALDESMMFSLRTPDILPKHSQWRLCFYESTQLIPAETGDFLLGARGASRRWHSWQHLENALLGGFDDTTTDVVAEGKHNVHVCMRMGFSTHYTYEYTTTNERNSMTVELKPNETYVFALTLDIDAERCKQRNERILNDFSTVLCQQQQRYETVAARIPKLSCDNKGLEYFFQLAPLYHESLKTVDCAGAVRAKTTKYWVWGWDSMISNQAALYWGDQDFIADMLSFIEDTSADSGGIAHAYTNANSVASMMPDAAQGIYICLLHHYFAVTGDREKIIQHYPFAKRILLRMLKSLLNDTGLFHGMSLFPDFPMYMKEDGSDASLFNNSLAYSSLRAMECLAELTGDNDTAEKLRHVLTQTRKNFVDTFFSPLHQTFVSSVDANSFKQRYTINVTSLMWENDFLEELIYVKDNACIDFIEKNCIGKSYLRAIPLWDDAFDKDANQLHCTWPVTDEYFVRLANRTGKTHLLHTWAGWVSYWTDQLLCPEGISYLIETETPEQDCWNCESGTWQAYTMRKWYQDIIHGYLGVIPDVGGIGFSPSGIGGYKIEGLWFKSVRLSIHCHGTGRYVDCITVGDETVSGTYKVPYFMVKQGVIEVLLREKPRSLELRTCYNAALTQWTYHEQLGRAFFSLTGYGTCIIRFFSMRDCKCTINSLPAEIVYDEQTKMLCLSVVLEAGQAYQCEINQINNPAFLR